MPLSTEQQSEARQLRADGLSYEKIAKHLRVSDATITDSAIWYFFNPKPIKPKSALPPPPPPKPSLLETLPLRSSCPRPKRFNPELFANHRQPSKPELYATLHQAVINTTRRA